MSRLPEPSEELTEVTYEDQIPVLEAEQKITEQVPAENEPEEVRKIPQLDWDELVRPTTEDDYASDAETVVDSKEVVTLPLDVSSLVVMGLEVEELEGQEVPAVRPCQIVGRKPDSKYHVDREHCLYVGNPTNPGVEMPDNARKRRTR